ncbi:protein PPP5D1-like isoform X2 [Pongo abelii]|uniref:protein PPP5D1-like isoform X2 n=1 Tax=Pongo abelii TaxID=9601 RepID=UPI0023E83B28|nr:protein PPP5D1-like isoform X2 [Pongo abelii]
MCTNCHPNSIASFLVTGYQEDECLSPKDFASSSGKKRQGLAQSPRLKCSGTVTVHYNLELQAQMIFLPWLSRGFGLQELSVCNGYHHDHWEVFS